MTVEHLNCNWLLSPGKSPLPQGRLTLDKDSGRILEIGAQEGAESAPDGGTTFLTPGLINAHTHLELYAAEPIPVNPGETMSDWILKVIERNRQLTPEEKRQACRQSTLEMIRTGTTCVNDITSDGTSLDVLSQIGMRGIVSPEFFYPFHHDDPDVSPTLERFRTFVERFGQHPLLSIGISPHSPFNVTPQACAKVLSAITPALVHTHLAETQEELEWFQQGTSSLDRVHEYALGQHFGPTTKGITPAESYRELLSPSWIAAHGVYLSDDDIALLAKAGVSLAHCPRSNLWITGETIPDYRKLQNVGIPIGLGTDSRLSNTDLDMREEGRAFCRAHALSAEEAFTCMTAGSAQAIKQADRLGQLAPGFAADLVLWWHPENHIINPYEAWLDPRTEVRTVWINGRVVLERSLS